MKQLTTLLLALILASVSWSQDTEDPGDTEADVAEVSETSAPGDPSEEEDDSYLDEPGYGLDEEEDDFIPSQEVTADQSLPFPVDI